MMAFSRKGFAARFFLSVLRLVPVYCALWLATAVEAAPDPRQIEARRQFVQAHAFTRGLDFGEKACAGAVPLLAAALEQWSRVPEPARDDAFAQLQLARCETTRGQPAQAVARLQALLARPARPENVLITSSARLALADLLAAGQGCAADPERALALYLLAEPQDGQDQRHRDRAAAEIVFKLNGERGSSLFHTLLERGSSPDNWLRSILVRQERNENAYDLTRRRLAALAAAVEWPDDAREHEALLRLRREAGEGLLRRGDSGRLPAAIVFLQGSGEMSTQQAEALEARLPHRLILPDGTAWRVKP